MQRGRRGGSESSRVRAIIQVLNSLPNTKCIKIHGGAYTETGTPDIIGCREGRMFVLECKVGYNKPTKIQTHRLKQWAGAGAVAAVVHSAEEVLECLGKR